MIHTTKQPVLTNTFCWPTFSRMYRMQSALRQDMVKFGFISQISMQKLANICLPLTVRSTSGWNWTPYTRDVSLKMAATMALSDTAQIWRPRPTRSMLSPCVSSTSCRLCRFLFVFVWKLANKIRRQILWLITKYCQWKQRRKYVIQVLPTQIMWDNM